MQEANLILHPW